MAKKKAAVQDIPAQAITVDGSQAYNIVEASDDQIKGWIGDAQFCWFKNGKRNSKGDDPKDLIFKQ
jgi:hypothetical protein